jgi:hypothetical protein
MRRPIRPKRATSLAFARRLRRPPKWESPADIQRSALLGSDRPRAAGPVRRLPPPEGSRRAGLLLPRLQTVRDRVRETTPLRAPAGSMPEVRTWEIASDTGSATPRTVRPGSGEPAGPAGGGSALGRRPGIIRYVPVSAGHRRRYAPPRISFRAKEDRTGARQCMALRPIASSIQVPLRCVSLVLCPLYSRLLLLASGGCANWLSTTPLPIPRGVGQINTRRPRNGRLQECNGR